MKEFGDFVYEKITELKKSKSISYRRIAKPNSSKFN